MVDVEDVYDEFSAGEKDALAIRSFLSNAVQSWSTAPRYVPLAGAATYDPRGWLGRPELDQVPTVLVWTRYLEAASDDALVTFDPGRGPELAIAPTSPSRTLPTWTPRSRISSAAGSRPHATRCSWFTTVTGPSRSPRRPPRSARRSPAGAPRTSRVAPTTEHPCRARRGASLRPVAVDYQGHGAEDFCAGPILATTDVDALADAGSSPLLVAATCLNAYFVDIGREALGSALLRTPNGGAWRVWASSALTLPTDHALLSKTLLSGVLDEGLTLGEATLKAKQAVTRSRRPGQLPPARRPERPGRGVAQLRTDLDRHAEVRRVRLQHGGWSWRRARAAGARRAGAVAPPPDGLTPEHPLTPPRGWRRRCPGASQSSSRLRNVG